MEKETNKKEKFAWRHGDVIVVKIDSEIKIEGDPQPPVLALGETTGHSHQIKDKAAAIFSANFSDEVYGELREKTGKIFKIGELKTFEIKHLKTDKPNLALLHEEHNPINLPAGNFVFWIQREWKEDGWAKVLD